MTPCNCGRLHPSDMDVMASALADAVIDDAVAKQIDTALIEHVIGHMTKKRRSRRVPDFESYYRFLAPHEARMKRSLKAYWSEQARVVVSNMKRTPGPIGGRSLAASRIKGLTFNELIEQWLFAKGPADKALVVAYKDLAMKLLVQSAVRASTQPPFSASNPLAIRWDVFNPNIEKWLKGYSIDLADEVNTATLDKLKGSLFEGWEAGESVPDLMNRVRDLYEEFDRSRAEMIARSESIRASAKGALETYKASGVIDRTIWVATPDERLCPQCEILDGTVLELEGAFFSTTYGDKKGDGPPAHPNCRCALAPILIGETINDDGSLSD
jgi:SPP1 gp7 family putative phage head morphogenesis protein